MDMENNKNNNNYGSVENQSMAADVHDVAMVTAKPRSLVLKCVLAAVGFYGCYMALSGFSTMDSGVSLLETSTGMATATAAETSASTLNLPSYLFAVDKNDEEYDKYADQLTSSYVIGGKGEGNLIPGEVEIVRFVEPHFVFRTYGGENKANQCGYWWVLDPPTGNKISYFDHFAICPEFNDATDIVRCRVPEGYIAVVGVGQSIKCESGVTMMPDPMELQLNGDICTQATKQDSHLACEYCSSNLFNLEYSSCSNEGRDYIDGFKFS